MPTTWLSVPRWKNETKANYNKVVAKNHIALSSLRMGNKFEHRLIKTDRIANVGVEFGQSEVGLIITYGFSDAQRLLKLVAASRSKELIFRRRYHI